jgi:2-hydroxy-3-keto-5-methylthiopentenyl-1-phosphate phosphatase
MSSAVLMDFDGTITMRDSSELVLRRFADERWRVYDDLMDRGEIGLEDCMKLQFAMVHESPDSIIAYLDQNVEARPGLSWFLHIIDKRECDVCIVSAGLDFFIEHFIKTRFGEFELKVTTGKAIWNDGAIRFAFPSIKNPGALDFKQDAVLEARKLHDRVIYIGDGPSDYNAARSSDNIYAVRGSRLAMMCSKESLPHSTFSSFSELEDDVRKYLF